MSSTTTTTDSPDEYDQAWLCAGDGLFIMFENLPQSIQGCFLSIIALFIAIHFMRSLHFCNVCCGCCPCCDGTPRPQIRKSVSVSNGSSNRRLSRSPSVYNNNSRTERCTYMLSFTFIIVGLLLLVGTSVGKFACYLDLSPTITRSISFFSQSFCYIVCGVLVIAIFILRLKQTFKDTAYDLKGSTLKWVMFGTSLPPLCIVASNAMILLDNVFMGLLLTFVADVLYCIMSFITLRMFLIRLNRVK